MDLKNGMIIKCNSEEEAQEFIKEAYKQGFKWFSDYHEGDEEKTCWGCVCDFNSEIYYHLEADEIIWSSMYSGNEIIEYSTLKEKIKTMCTIKGLSITKYIRNLIKKDKEEHENVYLELLKLKGDR